jgi:hypothetical protein
MNAPCLAPALIESSTFASRLWKRLFSDRRTGKLDEELSKVASREGVHRSVIVERALANELQVSVNHNSPPREPRALNRSLPASRRDLAAGASSALSAIVNISTHTQWWLMGTKEFHPPS